ncbi:hypothetical protein BaRGS_00033633 [Batillaria attramentaria]|uniref:Uncharacterized protein n=1 Tax=Batillaria attramentaria TaxID=370345 RepID=A0ABD0JKG0_9CAEN
MESLSENLPADGLCPLCLGTWKPSSTPTLETVPLCPTQTIWKQPDFRPLLSLHSLYTHAPSINCPLWLHAWGVRVDGIESLSLRCKSTGVQVKGESANGTKQLQWPGRGRNEEQLRTSDLRRDGRQITNDSWTAMPHTAPSGGGWVLAL